MVKKQAASNLPKVVHDCRELLLWMIPHLDKLPKNRRYTLGEKLENRLLAIMAALVEPQPMPGINVVCSRKRILIWKWHGNYGGFVMILKACPPKVMSMVVG